MKNLIGINKIKNKVLLFIFVTCTISSCSDFLDVNESPNAITQNPGVFLLPQIEMSIVGNYSGVFALHGSLWSQFYNQNNTANQYRRIVDMQVLSGDMNNNWNDLYSNALSDIVKLKEYSDANETNNPRLYLIATVLESFTYQVIFDAFGEAPYTDAIKGERDANFNPSFEQGENVYPQLISAIDNAIEKYNQFFVDNPSATKNLRADIAKQDYIFEGKLDDWLAFANSVKLKLAVRNYDYDNSGSIAVINALELEDNYLSRDAKVDVFLAEVDKENPLYAIDQNLNTKINLVANRTLSEFLTNNSDPREALIFKANSSGNELLDHGDHRLPSEIRPPQTNRTLVLDATRPAYLMTTSEVNFFRAELVVRGLITGDAKALYESGVKSAFERVGASVSDANTLLEGNYLFRTAKDSRLEDIGVQKWAAMANVNPFEAFLELNRMDYPEIVQSNTYVEEPPLGNEGAKLYLPKNTVLGTDYIRRYLLPESEQTSNSNFPTQNNVTDKLWWDIK